MVRLQADLPWIHVILGEMSLKPMTISTQRLQIRWGVVVMVAVNMIDVQLAMPLWYKATP